MEMEEQESLELKWLVLKALGQEQGQEVEQQEPTKQDEDQLLMVMMMIVLAREVWVRLEFWVVEPMLETSQCHQMATDEANHNQAHNQESLVLPMPDLGEWIPLSPLLFHCSKQISRRSCQRNQPISLSDHSHHSTHTQDNR